MAPEREVVVAGITMGGGIAGGGEGVIAGQAVKGVIAIDRKGIVVGCARGGGGCRVRAIGGGVGRGVIVGHQGRHDGARAEEGKKQGDKFHRHGTQSTCCNQNVYRFPPLAQGATARGGGGGK